MNKVNKVSTFDIVNMIFLVGIIPFLVYTIGHYPPISVLTPTKSYEYEFFNLLKVRCILFTAIIILLNAVLEASTSYNKFFDKEKIEELKGKKYIFIALILISTIIAFLISDYKNIALWGAIERYEGIFTHISYMIIFIYSISYFKKENAFKYFSYGILLSTFVVGAIGTLQALGFNIFNNEAVQGFLSSEGVRFTLTMDGSYTTMYNPNTSASYSLLMMHLLGVIFVLNEDMKVKIISIINFILVTVTFIFSKSEASYIGLVASIVTVIIAYIILFMIKKEKNKALVLFATSVSIFLVGIIMIFTNDRLNTMVNNTIDRFIGPVATFTDWEQSSENDFYFYNKDDQYIKVSIIDGGYIISEGDTQLFSSTNESIQNVISTENFGDIAIDVFASEIDGATYVNFNNYFLIKSSDAPYLAEIGNLREIPYVEAIGFEGYGNLFTNRGYIWSRSIPLMLSNPFGVGSDVFFQVFPNNDVVGIAFYDQPYAFVDKPHNIYLNMAINNGILYAIGFIGIVVLTLIDKLKLLYKSNDYIINNSAIIIYVAGIIAYLVNGLSTDNIVIVILLFWIYLSIDNKIFVNEKICVNAEDDN